MTMSRRQFLNKSAAAAAFAPLAVAGGIDYCEAATTSSVDLSQGFPDRAVRLNYNENTLGPSPKALEGALEAVRQSNRYALSYLLKPHIGTYHDIDPDWVLMGTGSSEILRLTPVAHARQGGNVVTPHETWDGSLAVAKHLGLEIRRIDLLRKDGLEFDVSRMLDAVDDETRIFHLVTPNNPTGTTLSYTDIMQIADALPRHVLFVLDQAYVDYSTERQSGLDLLNAGYTNVLVTRTFSKVYAMAGLRCGYGLAHPDILREIGKYGCGPACINMAGYGAVLGSLDDTQHATRSRKYVEECRTYYENRFDALDIPTVSGPPPFILAEFGEDSTRVHAELEKRKVFTTHGSTWHLPDYVRISYGTREENAAFFTALESVV